MADTTITTSRRVLDANDRMAEILFGLVMALTFTCSLSVATAGQAEVRTMLLGALGCNFAWGVIDGVFYLMGCLADRGRGLKALRALREATDLQAAQRMIADALPSIVASVLRPEEFDAIRERLRALPEPPAYARLTNDERLGALAVCALVFLSTLPVVIPFMLLSHPTTALRVSNAVAVVMLFAAGYKLGQVSGRSPWLTGVSLVVVGAAMVSLCIALGG